MANAVTVERKYSLNLCSLGHGTLPSALPNTVGSWLLLYLQN